MESWADRSVPEVNSAVGELRGTVKTDSRRSLLLRTLSPQVSRLEHLDRNMEFGGFF